jgi:hypothetical protein
MRNELCAVWIAAIIAVKAVAALEQVVGSHVRLFWSF